jgi:alkylation response protein AidB-like acyl-CoA dehydrogenase
MEMVKDVEQLQGIADFDTFISSFRDRLSTLFNVEYDYNKMSLTRGLPPEFLKEIMAMNPLSVAVPEEHAGRGLHVSQCLQVLSAASYESLSLSLIFGINIALFLEPFAKYGDKNLHAPVFRRFMEDKAMGGLMITEPAYGSDALNMRTCYTASPDGFHLKGQKHWQGLTGAADFWLVAARKKNEKGELVRDVDFFMTENADPAQRIEVERLYNNLGLYAIPYGINNIDINVPENHRLHPESTGIKLMLDMLHRSRLQFPGMGMGFIKRLLDETLQHCTNRRVAGMSLADMDAVKHQLSRIQAAYTICSGMCAYSSSVSSIANDLSGHSIDANSVKALVTDLMQESAQISLQLSGAIGYRLDHYAGRAVVDSRPFQIFEGSNEMLYTQVAEAIAKLMRKSKETNLLSFLKTYQLTTLSAPVFSSLLDFNLPEQPKQRDFVTLGRIIARVVCYQFVISLYDAGFNDKMVEITRQHMAMDIAMFVGQLSSKNYADPLIEYQDNADLTDFKIG